MLARNVACGQPSKPARICPTWFESPSTACLPSTTRSGFSRSTTALTDARDRLGVQRGVVAADQDRPVGAHRQHAAQLLLRRPSGRC